ncbi:hypothetical protein C8R44DRAFT_744922 [Mycena epipterygia]|nr:hypothetical protein C8R44DRAFT_744922 [Mycena epipterygia]
MLTGDLDATVERARRGLPVRRTTFNSSRSRRVSLRPSRITMRGAERPGKVKWTRPFLLVLELLSPSASRQIFLEVADEPSVEDKPALDDLGAIFRWPSVENTTLLSDGHDKRSNLETSVILSLGSPRISSSPHAKDLLSLLSLLPDGITQEDLVASRVPIPHIADCKSSLIRTSLAYVDNTARIRVLSPIREYMRRVHPPSPSLCKPLRTHFQDLLAIWDLHQQLPFNDLVPTISSYLGNINDFLVHVLQTHDRPAYLEVAYSILKVNLFSMITMQGHSPLIKNLPDLTFSLLADAEMLIAEGIQYFNTGDQLTGEAITFYNAASAYYHYRINFPMAIKFNDLAMAQKTNDPGLKLNSLRRRIELAQSAKDTRTIIQCVHEARRVGRFTSSFLEHEWLSYEASAQQLLSNLSRCLELCTQVDELLVQGQMEGSDRYLMNLDLRAAIYWEKTEYIEARKLYEMIAPKTCPIRSPYLHAHSLACLAYTDIMMARDEAEILVNLNAAKTLYAALGHESLVCSWTTAELYQYRGDVKDAQAEFEACLSKNRAQAPVDCLAALGDLRRKIALEKLTILAAPQDPSSVAGEISIGSSPGPEKLEFWMDDQLEGCSKVQKSKEEPDSSAPRKTPVQVYNSAS